MISGVSTDDASPRRGNATAIGDSTGPWPNWSTAGSLDHFVQFYDVDEALFDAVAGFMAAGLRAGDVDVVIATAAHREEIAGRLGADGLDVAAARDRGQYVDLDAAGTLTQFVIDGVPDAVRFAQVIEPVIARAGERGRRIRIFGEMVALLAGEGRHAGAVALEHLWNDLQGRYTFALFCAYPMTCLAGSEHAQVLADVCSAHAHVIPCERYTTLPTLDDRLRAVVQWEHKARALEAALIAEQAARQAAEEALRIREEFISIASHELRTPLTTLSGHAQMIVRQSERQDRLDAARVVQSAQVIRKQTARLSLLITQLLDSSRLDAGKLTLEPIPTDLANLVEQVVWAAQLLNEEHAITVDVPPVLEAVVDPVRLEQVLTNLLNNAVRYSRPGSEVEVKLDRPQAGVAEIAVRDHGPGVPVEKRDRLFERFYQAHTDGFEGGLGLGLYISRQITELHGGTIRAEFPDDGGARFVVRLPI